MRCYIFRYRVVLFMWNRVSEPSTIAARAAEPRHGLGCAPHHHDSPSIKIVLTRRLVTGLIGQPG